MSALPMSPIDLTSISAIFCTQGHDVLLNFQFITSAFFLDFERTLKNPQRTLADTRRKVPVPESNQRPSILEATVLSTVLPGYTRM